ncbi:unnamed protein product [Peronospora destructor]|uniref:NADP-dependent 3-hydroxy acid dehydrogenase YdfG n=1 Tax=Peronospora destructor TaxID=86335 RepID=A0AAV0V9N9_9STRA|nr:unnamed protein product [Peronospora destructor]
MSEGTLKRRERMNVVWKPVHLTGMLVLALAFIEASSIVQVGRFLLFLYFILVSLDLALTRYHFWNFESTVPELKRYALVTGASFGIGREMSYLLSEKKYSLVLTARSEKVLERMRAEIELVNRPTEVLMCVCDLATTKGINELIKFVKDKELIIDILVNNVGACLTKDFAMLNEAEVDDLMILNMQAMVKLTHAIVPQMVDRKIGRVLNISSILGASAVPTAALYSSSKAFVTCFSQALSYELRSTGVTVTCMCPGPVSTNFSKTANTEKAVLVYDTWFAYLSATLVQSIIPGRLAAFCFGAGIHELKDIWQMIKR